MDKRVLIIFFLLLVLVACTPQGRQTIGRGVKLEFIEYPKGELLETGRGPEPFGLGLQVSNFASVPVQGQICVRDTPFGIGGIPPNTCESVNLDPAFKAENGQVRENTQGLQFGPFQYQGLDAGKTYTTEISAELRYTIESRHFMDVCLVRDDTRSGVPGQCKDDASVSVTQDLLPLAVKNVKKEVHHFSAGNVDQLFVKLVFNMGLDESNVQIMQQGDSGFARSSKSLVSVRVHGFGTDFACTPLTREGVFDFRPDSTNELRCTANIPLEQDRQDDLVEVRLGYGAGQTVSIPSVKLIKQGDQGGVA